ncbi:hypothetical protein AOQ84DRAFT_352927 [Glonium stellatum]|uniref:Uncharacterized protein n=1 Tax=Glonium stellatum TaxID=574774 RepID=A0A8E2JWE9_9PEZI|nr:hypothetical protein AOQ84DRAFT_352927 [Glonium stellatum]
MLIPTTTTTVTTTTTTITQVANSTTPAKRRTPPLHCPNALLHRYRISNSTAYRLPTTQRPAAIKTRNNTVRHGSRRSSSFGRIAAKVFWTVKSANWVGVVWACA